MFSRQGKIIYDEDSHYVAIARDKKTAETIIIALNSMMHVDGLRRMIDRGEIAVAPADVDDRVKVILSDG